MSRLDDFYGAGAHPAGGSATPEQRADAARSGINRMFPEGALSTSVPWPQAGRTKARPRVDFTRAIPKELGQHPDVPLTELDPRSLHASQPGLGRAAVTHYMGNDYYETGRTFADPEQAGNRVPVVYRRPSTRAPGTSEDVIMSGHHRAAAALLRGEQFKARIVEGP